ncbi:MAG: hypothetical protein K9J06_07280 [Flavobacteriales bacterium]|nr:hypothetical protein [Flavobacteriales bacterium]
MGKLKQAVLDFVREDFNVSFYGGTLLLLALAVTINYSPLIDIQWVSGTHGRWEWLLHYVLLYGGLYYATALLGARGSKVEYLSNRWFWALSSTFILIAILPKVNFLQFVNIREHGEWSGAEKLFVHKCQFFFHQFVLTATFLVALKWALAKWMPLDLGLRWDWNKVRPYFLILLMVSPLMVAASFLPDFQQAYPQYKPWFRNELAFGLSNALRSAVFTSSYSSGFVAVEMLFRGALALGMFRIMGTRAVLPMAAFYCAFHFGKPMGEAIASILGSYLLGVLAIHGRSIAGGIIVHLGVAMLMELMGHLQHALR